MTMTAAQPETTSRWYGGRNTYLAEWGEYETCNSYTYTRTIVPRPEFAHPKYPHRLLIKGHAVEMVVRINGAPARSWSAYLKWGRIESRWDKWHGKCRSVKQALIAASALDLAPALREIAARLYTPGRHDCVYRADGEQWVPLMTDLLLWYDHAEWPAGKYLVMERFNGNPKPYLLDCTGHGYGGRFGPDNPTMPRWGDPVVGG